MRFEAEHSFRNHVSKYFRRLRYYKFSCYEDCQILNNFLSPLVHSLHTLPHIPKVSWLYWIPSCSSSVTLAYIHSPFLLSTISSSFELVPHCENSLVTFLPWCHFLSLSFFRFHRCQEGLKKNICDIPQQRRRCSQTKAPIFWHFPEFCLALNVVV